MPHASVILSVYTPQISIRKVELGFELYAAAASSAHCVQLRARYAFADKAERTMKTNSINSEYNMLCVVEK